PAAQVFQVGIFFNLDDLFVPGLYSFLQPIHRLVGLGVGGLDPVRRLILFTNDFRSYGPITGRVKETPRVRALEILVQFAGSPAARRVALSLEMSLPLVAKRQQVRLDRERRRP